MAEPTTIVSDLLANAEFAARQWEIYKKATRAIGDTESLRHANQGLGYNLVKTIPGLLEWIEELHLQKRELERRLTASIKKDEAKDKVEVDKRPIGIPAEHIILNTDVEPQVPNDSFGVFYTS